MSIRFRLTLWYTMMLGGILVLFGLVMYVVLERYLVDNLDAALRERTVAVHGAMGEHVEGSTHLDVGMVHVSLPAIDEFSAPGIYIQILDDSGRVAASSPNLQGQQLPLDPELIRRSYNGEAILATLPSVGGEQLRLLMSPLYYRDRAYLLLVGGSMHHVWEVTRQVLILAVAGVVLGTALAFGIGSLVTRKALEPLESMSNTVSSIELAPHLGRRVVYHGPQDEIGRLASTFNAMLSRIEKTLRSQKNFIADSSHELRTPLTVIRGNVDLLKRNLNEEDRRDCLRAMEEETVRMGRIVSDLMLLAQMDAEQTVVRAPVSLSQLVREVYEDARIMAGERTLALNNRGDLTILGDADKLKQLVRNLVDNAVKYSSEDSAITISLKREGGWARLEVADTGIGIPEEHHPYIFDRFYRVDKARSRARGGTGLGLAIVKSIAETHGGTVTVSSQVGVGSVFTVFMKL